MFKSAAIKLTGLVLLSVPLLTGALSGQVVPDSGNIMGLLESEDFNRILDRAIAYQLRADELGRLAVEWRKEASRMDDPVERGRLQKRIMQVEDSVDIYTGLSNEQFMILNDRFPESRVAQAVHTFLVRDTVLNGITVYHYNLNEEFMGLLEDIRSGGPGGEQELSAARGEGSSGTPAPEIGEKAGKGPANASFSIMDSSPYGAGKSFEHNFSIPPGVFYRIQIAVFRNQPPADQFGGLSPITTERIPERDLTRYFVGKFTRMDDAGEALDKVRSLGYPDAFIIGYYDGKKSTFSKLNALEE